MKKQILFLAMLVLALPAVADTETAGSVQGTATSPDAIDLMVRLKGNYSLMTGAGADGAAGASLELETDIAKNFALGALVNATFVSRQQQAKIVTLGINPKFVINKGRTRIGFGGIVGVQLKSDSAASSRALAVGVNASLDVPIYESLYFTFAPAYIQGLQEGPDVSEALLSVGLSVSL